RRQLAALQALAAWREREAQRRDMPRRRIMKDEALAELATQMPTTREALAGMRLVPEGMARSAAGREILETLRGVAEMAEEDLPELPARRGQPPEGGPKADILKLALKIVCERERIAPKLIASAQDLERLAAGERDLPVLKGWRREVFGGLALELLAGRRVIGLEDDRPAILPAGGA
ncbi:MAG TPA: ribonuclease D, partial [Thermopetrobacter sp.]|nr:ribonuclease D [Thermopetrobacter sp.]